MSKQISLRERLIVLAGLLTVGCLHMTVASAQELPSQVNVQFGAVLPHDANGNGISDHSTRSGVLLVDYKLQMNKWTAGEVDYGKTRYTQTFSGGSGPGSVQSNLHQLNIDFLLRIPEPIKRIHTYALVGTGMFRFVPTGSPNNLVGVTSRTRAAGIFGVGADVDLSKRIGVRADYRIDRFEMPDFYRPALNIGRDGHISQPSVGVFFKFGGFHLGKIGA